MRVVQIALGIATLLLAVPVALGAAHQGGALLLLTAMLAVAHFLLTDKELLTKSASRTK